MNVDNELIDVCDAIGWCSITNIQIAMILNEPEQHLRVWCEMYIMAVGQLQLLFIYPFIPSTRAVALYI